jgi:hypothetical protein
LNTEVYFRYTLISTNLTFEFIRRPLPPILSPSSRTFVELTLVNDTPTSIVEAYAAPDADDWKEDVHNEMDLILSNGTWELSERPHGCKPVGCKWRFKKQLRPDGTVEKYKVKLVAKCYTQKEGENYFDTYSPIAGLTTIRVLVSMAASYDLTVHQMDIKIAFLN